VIIPEAKGKGKRLVTLHDSRSLTELCTLAPD
jgi:hypothetical protein